MWHGIVICAVLIFAAGENSLAEPVVSIIGQGNNSCGSWTQQRQAAPSIARGLSQQWVAGYLSGANVMGARSASNFDVIRKGPILMASWLG